MPRRLYPCTPTRLSAWLDCPRRYRMTYLDRPAPAKGPPWAHNSFGASVHNALAGWWRLAVARRTVAAAGDLLERGWIDEGYADPAQSRQHRGKARDMVERYAGTLDPRTEPLGVERTVGAHTARIVVSGRVDRLDARRSLPLALYALAAARIFHAPCHLVELHHLPTGQVYAWEHSDATVARHVGRAEAIAAECEEADARFRAGLAGAEVDQVFPPRPGPACGWCDFRAHCPEGSAAAPAHKPWDGLASDGDVAD